MLRSYPHLRRETAALSGRGMPSSAAPSPKASFSSSSSVSSSGFVGKWGAEDQEPDWINVPSNDQVQGEGSSPHHRKQVGVEVSTPSVGPAAAAAAFDLQADSLETKHSKRYLHRVRSGGVKRTFPFIESQNEIELDSSLLTDTDLSEVLRPSSGDKHDSPSRAGSFFQRSKSLAIESSEYETEDEGVTVDENLVPSLCNEEEEVADEDWDDEGNYDQEDGGNDVLGLINRGGNEANENLPVQPPNPQPQPAIDNGFGFNFDDFGNIDAEMEAQEVGLEVRVALFDLLGVDSINIMLRNALWLLAFIALFMLTLFSLPYLIGGSVTTIFQELYLRNGVVAKTVDLLVSSAVREIFRLVLDMSVKFQNPIHFFDIATMGLGFCTIFAVVFMLNAVLQTMYSHLPRARFAIATASDLMARLAVIVKVGLLLVVRIFVLPILLGN